MPATTSAYRDEIGPDMLAPFDPWYLESQLCDTATCPGRSAARSDALQTRDRTSSMFLTARISSAPRKRALHCVRDTNQAAVKSSTRAHGLAAAGW